MAKITYTDKEAINIDPSIPAKNKCMAVDLNEIKSVINMTLDTLKLGTDTWNSNITYGLNAIVVYNNEVYENITGTSTTTNPSSDTTNWLKITYDYFMGAVKQLPITALGSYNVYKCDIENINTGFYVVNGIDTEVNLHEGNDFIYTINNFAIIGYTTLGQINIFMNGKVISCYKDNNVWRTTDLFKSYQKLIAVSSSAPSQCSKGDKYFNTSTKQIYEATATNIWSSTGNTPQADIFYVVFDTDSMTIYAYNGTTLVGVGSSGAGGESIPVGVSVAYMGTTAPQGYLMEDGTLKLISEYPELYNVLGHRYDLPTDTDNTKFRLPNKCGRVLVGLDSAQTEFDTLGETGGSKTKQFGLNAHTCFDISGNTLSMTWSNSENWQSNYAKTISVGQDQTQNTFNTGVNVIGTTSTESILQPYIVVNYIIKAHPSAVNTSEVVNEYSTSETNVYSANYVNTELNKKQNIVNYSTSEVDTGIKWTDNRPVYRKVINTTSPSSVNSWTQIATISNLRDVIKLEGWVYASNGRILPIQFSEPNAEISTTILNNGIEMKVIESSWCNSSCMMIAEYTKTTD